MVLHHIIHTPRIAAAAVIRCYQMTLSPDHGRFMKPFFPNGYCRYHPTCSEYGRRAMLRYGLFFGSMKIMYRIFRCNPWSNGGIDEVVHS